MFSKIHLTFFCHITFLLNFSAAFSQSLHVFSVIESDDVNRPDRLVDQDNVAKTSTDIASYLGMEKYYYDFGENHSFSVSSVRQTLARLKRVSCSNDIIWFHFSGYGRNNGQGIWPVVKLADGEIELTDIISALQEKHPKLILVTAESGNKYAEPKEFSNQTGEEINEVEAKKLSRLNRASISPKITLPVMRQIPHFSLIENYERLFRQFEGMRVVILGSSGVGQSSVSSVTRGSEWLSSFCKILNQKTDEYTRSATWESINKLVVADIQSKSKTGQKPQGVVKTISIECQN